MPAFPMGNGRQGASPAARKALLHWGEDQESGKERIDNRRRTPPSVIAMVKLFPETEEEDWLLRFVYPILIAVIFLITFALIMYSQTPTV